MKARSGKWWIYALIMVLQILVILYWGSVKVNYNIDELYSKGYASNITGKPWNAQYITTGQDFRFREWVENAKYKEYVIVSEEERMFCESPLKAARLFLTWKNYMAFLNVAESIAGYSFVSSRPGLALNIVFFVLAEISLLALMKKLGMDDRVRALALAMFGLSRYVLSMAEYIRFYMLLTLFLLLALNLLHRLWNAETWRGIVLSEAGVAFLAYLSYKNSELSVAFFGALFVSYAIATVLAKKRRHILVNVIIGVAGIAYIGLMTPYIGILLHPERASVLEEVMREARINISGATFSTILDYLAWVRSMIETYYFASRWIFYLLFGAVTICLVLHVEKNGKCLSTGSFPWISKMRAGTVCALLGWLVLLFLARGSVSSILVSLMMLFLLIFLVASKAVGKLNLFRRRSVSPDMAYMGILLGAVLLYTVFCAMCGYTGAWRYFCFGFISLTIILWFIVDRALKTGRVQEMSCSLLWILAAFVIVNAGLLFITRNIEYMYEDERSFISRVEGHQSLNAVLFVTVGDESDRWSISRHDLYDCVNLMSPESMIYTVNLDKYDHDKIDYPKEFVLWSHVNNDLSTVVADLEEHDYTLEELGTDHCSRAYYCRAE